MGFRGTEGASGDNGSEADGENQTHWTLIGFEVERLSAVKPRAGLHIHAVAPRGDIVDNGGYVRGGYGIEPGEWVLVRPDGYIGAIVSSAYIPSLEEYLDDVGLTAT